MGKIFVAGAIVGLAVSLGCVINKERPGIPPNIPDIRHIADQAGQVLDYIEGKTDSLPGVWEDLKPVSRVNRLLNAVDPIQPVWADMGGAPISPLMVETASRMRARNGEVGTLKHSGCLGESSRGLVELRECEMTRDVEAMNTSQKTVSEENKDRSSLYNEVARMNKNVPEVNVAKIQAIYVMERLRRGRPGEAFQLPSGPDFDAINASGLGRKLGNQCKPGAWILIPD